MPHTLSKGLVTFTACTCVELPKTGGSNQIGFYEWTNDCFITSKSNCDWICKKGSYTYTPFQIIIILWIYYQVIHVCMCCGQQFTGLLFLTLLSETCQMSMNAQFVFSQRRLGCKVSHGLVV